MYGTYSVNILMFKFQIKFKDFLKLAHACHYMIATGLYGWRERDWAKQAAETKANLWTVVCCSYSISNALKCLFLLSVKNLLILTTPSQAHPTMICMHASYIYCIIKTGLSRYLWVSNSLSNYQLASYEGVEYIPQSS